MLRSLKELERYTVSATEGDIGTVVDFLLDDEKWAVRYLVVKTDGFFDGVQVLISPISFRGVDWSTRHFELALTKDKVRHSPSVELDKPVSRQHEWGLSQYYGYSPYWGYTELWGMAAYPQMLAAAGRNGLLIEPSGDVHLRSASEVRGYHVRGSDEDVGHIEDFIVDDQTWEVRYLVVDTSNWWFGKKVLIAPHWASHVSWHTQHVHINLSRDVIKSSPEWDPSVAVNREYEVRLYDYYGRPLYWEGGDPRAEAHPSPQSTTHQV